MDDWIGKRAVYTKTEPADMYMQTFVIIEEYEPVVSSPKRPAYLIKRVEGTYSDRWAYKKDLKLVIISSCKSSCCEDGNKKDCPFRESV